MSELLEWHGIVKDPERARKSKTLKISADESMYVRKERKKILDMVGCCDFTGSSEGKVKGSHF